MRVRAVLVAGLAGIAACGGGRARDDSGSGVASAAPVLDAAMRVPDPALRPLGAAALEAYAYRHGPGAAAYARALASEKRDDWAGVVAACREARAADPAHIDAAWLEAAGLARQGAVADMLEPLGIAAAGDWAKWGERSLTLPLFADFRASPHGAAWLRVAERYRDAYGAALARAVIAIGRPVASKRPRDPRQPSEVFAYDPVDKRWLRLTRSGGTIAAVLDAPGAPFLAYVAIRGAGSGAHVRVGAIDRASGKAGRELDLGAAPRVALAWRPSKSGEPALEVELPAAHHATAVWRVDWRRGSKTRGKGPLAPHRVVIAAGAAQRDRLPIANVTADWDDDHVASAFRIETSGKTIEPSKVVDGDTMAWAPDGVRLAYASLPEGPCTARQRVRIEVVHAATGKLRSLGMADAPGQVRWVDGAQVAYVVDDAIRVVDAATGAERARIAGGGGLALEGLVGGRGCDADGDPAVFSADPDDPGLDDDAPVDDDAIDPHVDGGMSDAGFDASR